MLEPNDTLHTGTADSAANVAVKQHQNFELYSYQPADGSRGDTRTHRLSLVQRGAFDSTGKATVAALQEALTAAAEGRQGDGTADQCPTSDDTTADRHDKVPLRLFGNVAGFPWLPMRDSNIHSCGGPIIGVRMPDVGMVAPVSAAPFSVVNATFSITVRTLHPTNIQLDGLYGTDTIAHIKEKIYENTGVPSATQILIFGGRRCKGDNCMLKEFDITDGSLLHLTSRLRSY